MISNALNDKCSSHKYEYFAYFEKIIFSEIYAVLKILNEKLYYLLQTEMNNKILVEIHKIFDVNNKY